MVNRKKDNETKQKEALRDPKPQAKSKGHRESNDEGKPSEGSRANFAANSWEASPEEFPLDPMPRFSVWYGEAVQAYETLEEASVMTLSTVDTSTFQPTGRVVLLKDFSAHCFTFYTNYESRKAQELKMNPRASLVLHWFALQKQIRIEGRVERVPKEVSVDYFATRSRSSQLAACASAQSYPIASRKALMEPYLELEKQFKDQPVPCPPHWGGYRLKPHYIEFWQGRENRLHDRIAYTKGKGLTWTCQYLAP